MRASERALFKFVSNRMLQELHRVLFQQHKGLISEPREEFRGLLNVTVAALFSSDVILSFVLQASFVKKGKEKLVFLSLFLSRRVSLNPSGQLDPGVAAVSSDYSMLTPCWSLQIVIQ